MRKGPTACVSNADLNLTDRERQLIEQFRAADDDCKDSIIRAAESLAKAFPALRPRPTLAYSSASSGRP
jgi:hypothetical protein